jgi:hypothetical protein
MARTWRNRRQLAHVVAEYADHYDSHRSHGPSSVAVVDVPIACADPVSWTDIPAKSGPARGRIHEYELAA